MKKTEKIRYEVDPHNRLVSEKTGKETEVPGFRTILDGDALRVQQEVEFEG